MKEETTLADQIEQLEAYIKNEKYWADYYERQADEAYMLRDRHKNKAAELEAQLAELNPLKQQL